ncbi:hypothetical protein SK128_011606 [Halocaridina rubra]|uniref:Uncharacterized protein n=1 Tax=Halocaridina rubra TaxID=373956 RepID=A0AAN8X0T9_HALRR
MYSSKKKKKKKNAQHMILQVGNYELYWSSFLEKRIKKGIKSFFSFYKLKKD